MSERPYYLLYARSASRGVARYIGVFDDVEACLSAWSESKFAGHPDAEMCVIDAPEDCIWWDEGRIRKEIASTPVYKGKGLVRKIKEVFESAVEKRFG